MKRQAFTLIELLVVVAIIAILTLITTAVIAKANRHAQMTKEIAGGRNLASAYLMYATENNGELMPGYVATAPGVKDDYGQEVSYPASGRYPWRVAKYLPGPVKGTLLINKQEKLTEKRDHDFYVYLVSFAPSFGMNATFVGGNFRTSLAPTETTFSRFGKFCVTRIAEALKPQRLILFCSAHFNSTGDEGFEGHHLVEPPNTTSRIWSTRPYNERGGAEEHGYVHLRYGGRAAAVMMDGHVELLDFEQIKDMRRWSNQAAEFDAPDFVLSRH
jgi:prepilin-type N-terminal cleavage/methylation domain-containing protein/prepilin-type processing-associated H-X9-DG protein